MYNFFKKLNRKRKANRTLESIQKNFIHPLKDDLRESHTIYSNNNLNNEISKLCELHDSDKGYIDYNLATPNHDFKPHNYANYYLDLFDAFKNEVKLVFECGVGTYDLNIRNNMVNRGTKPGASLRMWKDYFKNAYIFGADIDKKILFNEERISTFYVNQLEKDSIISMWNKVDKKNFDIIIDDGLHTLDAAVTLFENSFFQLKKNGIYIIEDVHFLYLNNLVKKLIRFNPQVITLAHREGKKDNNLVVFRKRD
mgnify:CR=1 FL=1